MLSPLLRSESRRASFMVVIGCLGIAAASTAMAQSGGTSCTNQATAGFTALGAAFGYFLTYSIRHGSKTQDVFKSFLGAIGITGGAATTLVVEEACRFPMLVNYGAGALMGFVAFAVLALVLVGIYSLNFESDQAKLPTKWALFAETLGKVLLGEDFRPGPNKKAT